MTLVVLFSPDAASPAAAGLKLLPLQPISAFGKHGGSADGTARSLPL